MIEGMTQGRPECWLALLWVFDGTISTRLLVSKSSKSLMMITYSVKLILLMQVSVSVRAVD
jgi:hypothetical protein